MSRGSLSGSSGSSFLESSMRKMNEKSPSARTTAAAAPLSAERSDLDKWLADSNLLIFLPYLQKQGVQSLDSIEKAAEKVVNDDTLTSNLRERFAREVNSSFRIQVEPTEEYDIYIVHMWEGKNSEFARHLKAQLERANKSLKVYDLFNKPAPDHLDGVLRKCANVVVVWHDRLARKPAMLAEIRAALRAKRNVVLVYDAAKGAEKKDKDKKPVVPNASAVSDDLAPIFATMRGYRRDPDLRDEALRGILKALKPRKGSAEEALYVTTTVTPLQPSGSSKSPTSKNDAEVEKKLAVPPIPVGQETRAKTATKSDEDTARQYKASALAGPVSIHRHPLHRFSCREAYGSSCFACDKCAKMFHNQHCYHCSVCGNFDLCASCFEAASSNGTVVQQSWMKPTSIKASSPTAAIAAVHEHGPRFPSQAE